MPELLQWYGWTDGVAPGDGAVDPELIPGFLIPSFKRALITYQAFVTLPETPISNTYWRKGWFSILDDFAGGGLMLSADVNSGDGRIYILTEGSESEPAFVNLKSMALSMTECYRAGVYEIDAEENVEERLDLSKQVYRRFNPTLSIWKS